MEEEEKKTDECFEWTSTKDLKGFVPNRPTPILTPIIKPLKPQQVSPAKTTKRSSIAVALILFVLLWFAMQWVFAGPRNFRATPKGHVKDNTVSILCENNTRDYNRNNTRLMIGSWQANTWIPPDGWEYISLTTMQQLYTNKTIVWLGDSLSRRTALTWHSLLTTFDPQDASLFSLYSSTIIDVTKEEDEYECPLYKKAKHRPKICRLNSTYPFLQVRENCWTHVLQFLHDENKKPVTMSHDPDLIVVAVGTWDIDVKMTCRLDNHYPLTMIVEKTVVALNRVASNQTRVVVRTAAYSDWGEERAIEIDELNEVVMDQIDQMKNPYLTYIHWGGAMKPRALYPNRITGDNRAHFGVEGRLVLIHMLTNHLLDVAFFDSDV
jgi:hypothetical protein